MNQLVFETHNPHVWASEHCALFTRRMALSIWKLVWLNLPKILFELHI
jgi:hypothetical protein